MTRILHLPFRFKKLDEAAVITSECGDLYLLPVTMLDTFLTSPWKLPDSRVQDLLAANVLTLEDSADDHLNILAARYRTRKAFLLDFTVLHMVVPTIACDSECRYCQVSSRRGQLTSLFMSKRTANRVVDLIMASPASAIKVEFQGGEPLLHFEAVRYITRRLLASNIIRKKTIEFVLCTNLLSATREQLTFLRDHDFAVSTSLDGPRDLHDSLRPTRSGDSGYARFCNRLELAREVLGQGKVSALLTVARPSLDRLDEIADTYRELGFHSICLRKLNPFGRAHAERSALGYGDEEYVEKMLACLEHIFAVNRDGYFLAEEYSTMLMRRILTPFGDSYVDLLSPSGGGVACAVYNYDGRIYVSDEGRMLAEEGCDDYCIGDAMADEYREVFGSGRLRAYTASHVLESRSGCCDCVYLPYCGSETVDRDLSDGSDRRRRGAADHVVRRRCWKHLVFDGLVKRLSDPRSRSVFEAWVRN